MWEIDEEKNPSVKRSGKTQKTNFVSDGCLQRKWDGFHISFNVNKVKLEAPEQGVKYVQS